jgi:hypothetical protein
MPIESIFLRMRFAFSQLNSLQGSTRLEEGISNKRGGSPKGHAFFLPSVKIYCAIMQQYVSIV